MICRHMRWTWAELMATPHSVYDVLVGDLVEAERRRQAEAGEE